MGLAALAVSGCSGDKTSDTSAMTSDTTTNGDGWFEDCPIDEREQRLVEVGDLTFNVACRGAGPTVVFLHGFPEFHYSWDAVMDELVDDYRLIAPDQRGYNTSDKPELVEDYELPLLVDDILQLLPLISPDPVLLVAHDWGGPVGWVVAHTPDSHVRGFMSTNGPHPIRFAELLATDADQQAASSYMDLFRSEEAEEYLTADVLETWFDEFLGEEDLAIYREAWEQPGAITGGLNWYRANTLSDEEIDTLMEDRSSVISMPVSVLWGVDDTAVLVSNAEGLDEYASDLEVELIEDVDHWIEHHVPDEVANAIRSLDARAQ